MNALRIVQLMKFELARHFLTKKAWLALLAFALVWLMIYRYGVYEAVSILANPDFEQFVMVVFGNLGIQSMLRWPDAEMTVYVLIASVTFPPFIIYLCSDQFVSDRERGTLRFISLRATRLEIVLGRFLGHCLSTAALIAISLCGAIILVALRDMTALDDALNHAVQFELLLLVNLMPFIALMSLLNTVARSARMALIYTILLYTIGMLIVTLLQVKLGLPVFFDYLFPGEPMDQIVTLRPDMVSAVIWPLIQSALFLALGFWKFQRGSI
ncbi:ABC transporter permease [Pseudoalteromonas sp. SSDWG2]|uniref:ABC transporter permease n=1 Tax=Pseudoalteromonas sp. SSDWG2 TaxID=3139391 RepID=UPI003BAD6407